MEGGQLRLLPCAVAGRTDGARFITAPHDDEQGGLVPQIGWQIVSPLTYPIDGGCIRGTDLGGLPIPLVLLLKGLA